MRRPRICIPALLALSAQLTTVWLALAPGLVVCIEEDGGVAVEASINDGVCGSATPSQRHRTQPQILAGPASDHCEGCVDVPLSLASEVAAGHQHATVTTSPAVATPFVGVAPVARLTHPLPATSNADLDAPVPSQRSTILRI